MGIGTGTTITATMSGWTVLGLYLRATAGFGLTDIGSMGRVAICGFPVIGPILIGRIAILPQLTAMEGAMLLISSGTTATEGATPAFTSPETGAMIPTIIIPEDTTSLTVATMWGLTTGQEKKIAILLIPGI